MPALKNTRHERFAQELAKGKSQVEAYGLAGYEPNESHASRLVRNGKVASRLAELQDKAATKAELTLADIIAELEQARMVALAAATPQTGSAVAASMGKAKLLGLVVDRSEVEQTVEVTDARERLARIVSGHTAAAGVVEGSGKPH
jgi:phage terminase small subunit